MLSIGKLSVGQEAYYLAEVLDGAEDYYLHAAEAAGRWLGAGATAIGLDGEVSADDLRSVLAGNDPGSGESLRSTSASLPGLDLTLSAPKSVSLVWGLGDEVTAGAVVGCHERAVDAAITYLERHACHVRRGHAGAEKADGHGFIAAGFRHRTSRLGDPTLHTHVLIANVTEGADRRWTALDARPIYRQARTAGFVYQAVLRYELARSMGLLFEEVEQGHADVAGIPVEMRREFSGRRRQILDQLERHGASSAKAAQAATLDTRNAKSEHVPEDELRRRWAARAERFGVSVEGLPTLVRTPVLDQSDDDIAARVTEANATFERRDVVRVIAQHATQGGALDDIEARADEFLESNQAINLTSERWTTPEMLAIERRTVELALAGVGTGCGLVAPDLVDGAIADRPSLGADQTRAVQAITRSGASVDVLVGPAGTGKTFCLDAARDAWESGGHRVVGVALAARAAVQLELGAGISSQTADRLLVALQGGKRRLDDRTVLVVDESGMLGTRRLAALIAEAEAARAKVVLVGDPKQLPEIDAGGLFASLAQRLGYAELTRNRRQWDVQERAAAHELRHGQVDRAMARLQRNGNVSTADNADLLRDGLVGDWYAARVAGDDVAMVAGHLAKVRDLRPLLVRRPQSGRFVVGQLGRRLIATESPPQRRGRGRASGRGAVALVGPTRSGKTTAAIGGILDWDGPAILCSVKSDLLAATRERRASLGSIQVFDPSGVTGHGDASWSPLREAETTTGAVQAARAIVEAAPRTTNVEQGEFWSQMAESLLAGLMCVAANTNGRTFADVVRWIVATDMPTDDAPGEVAPIVRALRADGDPVRKQAGEFGALVVEGLWRNDPRTVSSVYATARTIVWPWIDPLVAEATKGCTVDLKWLLDGSNTLYICVPVKDQHRLRPVLGGLLNDLMSQAFDQFVATNEPLDPAVLVVIDEAAIIRPDQLPSWAATLSGIGVQLVTAWQSVSQIEAAYRRDSPAILTNHLTKLFFAGMSDSSGLDYVSRLLGDEHLPSQLAARTQAGGQNTGPVATVPVVPPAALRRIHPGDALLIHGTLPPAHVRRRGFRGVGSHPRRSG